MNSKNLLFSILATFLLSTINAQIVYTDINPDITTTLGVGGTYVSSVVAIDFNNDGTEEYNFRWDDYGSSGWFMHMTYANGNEFNLKGTATNPYGGRYIQAMNQGQDINASANWGSSSPEPFIGDNADPNFKGLGDKYVGVKFKIGGNTYYGWVLVSFDNSKKLTIKEYAYESTPNKAIKAGDKGSTSINIDKNNKKINIYPNPAKDFIIIDNSINNILKIDILNINGMLIKSFSPADKKIIKLSVSDLPKGIYIVRINNEENTNYFKKLIIN